MSTSDFYKDTIGPMQAMNKTLAVSQHELFAENVNESLPQIFIIGPPRSGKMFTYASLIKTLNIGYIDNIIMRFWEAPLYGIQLSKNILQSQRLLSYSSYFGLTPLSSDPGEFPYFWHKWLGTFDDPIALEDVDLDGLGTILKQMAHAMGTPLAHQPPSIFYHLHLLPRILNNVLFIRLWRNLEDNAMSILKARRAYGGENTWVSVRPTNFETLVDLPWAGQIAGQLKGICDDTNDRLAEVPHVIDLDFAKQCANPGTIVEQVADWLDKVGHRAKRLGEPPESYVPAGYAESPDKKLLRGKLLDHFTAKEIETGGL